MIIFLQNCGDISRTFAVLRIFTKISDTLLTHLFTRGAFEDEPLNYSNREDSPPSYDVLFNSIEYRLDGFGI